MEKMPKGWERLNHNTATHGPVAISGNDLHSALDLMKEMAEALQEFEDDQNRQFGSKQVFFRFPALKKFKEWK